MAQPVLPNDTIQDILLGALKGHGFETLPEADQAELVVQFMAQLETRIGAALITHLSAEGAAELQKLFDSPNVSPETWREFWQHFMPNYEHVVTEIVVEFVREIEAPAEE